MSLRPFVAKPSPMAVCLGVIAMVLVYGSGSLLLSLARPQWLYEANESRVVSLVFPVATYLVSGYVVGYFAKRAPLMHGALLGLLVMGLFACGTLALGGDISPVRFAQLTVGAMVICCLGAILGDSIAQR